MTTIPFSKSEILSLAEQIKHIVLETGDFLLHSAISSVKQKEGHANFVTDLDLAVQNRLVKALSPLCPNPSFLLEESDIQSIHSDFVWIIDPIDGTQNFINQYNQSAISVGLTFQNTGLIGVVYNPFLNELFIGIYGQGASCNNVPIYTSKKELENSIISIGTSPYYDELHALSIATLHTLYQCCGDFRRTGSAALDLCYTAAGRCDGFFEYRLSPWDYAAAAIIMTEAGGTIASITESSFDFTKTTGIVAGGENIFNSLWDIIQKQLTTR